MLARVLRPTPVVTAIAAAAALVFAVMAARLGFWTDDGPGPGLLPFATAALLLPLLMLVLREGAAPDESPFTFAPIGAVLLAGLYAAVLPYLGFLIPTFVLVAAWIRLLYRQGWARAVVLGLGLTAGATLLFARLLQVPMPLIPAFS